MNAVLARGLFVAGYLATSSLSAATRNGDLDPNFGQDGQVLADVAAGSGHWVDMAMDSQGRFVLAGSRNAGPATGYDFVVVRLLPDGSPDGSFSFDGRAELAVGPDDSYDYAYAVLVQTDGKIIVAGAAQSSTPGNGQDMAFVRFLANGDVDTGFGVGGKVFIDFGLSGGADGSDLLRGLVQLPDGKLIGAGSTSVSGQSDDMAIVKLNTDGTRDTSFGTGGRATVRFSLSPQFLIDQANAVAIDGAGRIVVAGLTAKSSAADYDMAVARLLPNGQLDVNFSGDGRATVTFDLAGNLQDIAYGLRIVPDNSLLLVGAAEDVGPDIAVARLLPDGSPDNAFGGSGRVTVPFDLGGTNMDFGISVVPALDGRFVVAGLSTGVLGRIYCPLVQLLPDGQLDPDFGVVGKALIDNGFGGDQTACTRAFVQDQRLWVGGLANTKTSGTDVGFIVGAALIDVLFSDDYEQD